MPRPTTLSKVSTTALQAELARRAAQLGKLLRIRDDVDRQLADLKGLAGQFGQAVAVPAPVAEESKPVVRRRRRRKVKAGKVVAKLVAKTGKRGQYEQTGSAFILGLLAGGKTLTSAELAQAWAMSGRGGKIDTPLSRLVQAKKLKRRKIRREKGSTYSLTGSAGSVARIVTVKPVARPAANRRGRYAQTASQFILALLKDKTLTTQQVNEAWTKAGRGGVVNVQLSRLVKLGKIKRKALVGKPGNNYSLA